jgi:hypothetical protein
VLAGVPLEHVTPVTPVLVAHVTLRIDIRSAIRLAAYVRAVPVALATRPVVVLIVVVVVVASLDGALMISKAHLTVIDTVTVTAGDERAARG